MAPRLLLLSFASSLIFLAWTQQKPFAVRRVEMSIAAEQKGLATPFKGITTDGNITPGLYRIAKTGVPTTAVRDAASRFLASLTPAQRASTQFPIDDPEWRKWMNQDFYVRQGMGFATMTDTQRDAAFALFKAALSPTGYQLSRDIMHLNETLGELSGDMPRYGEWAYWISIFGEPSPTKPWGFQVDGHHLIINYFVLGDQIVMTPLFLGSEPVIATSGKYKGTVILQREHAAGLEFLLALPPAARERAVLSPTKTTNHNRTESWQDNAIIPYEGIAARDLPAPARQQLLDLIALYIGNMDSGHARVKMEEVRRHLADTHFAWIGGTDPKGVYYYRIHSPVVMIEFDHQQLVGIRHLSKTPNLPDHDHIHVVVRTPNGNDYGKDLLRQHLATQRH